MRAALAVAIAYLLASCVHNDPPRTFAKGSTERRDDAICRGHVRNSGPSTYAECRQDLIEMGDYFHNMPGVPAQNPAVVVVIPR